MPLPAWIHQAGKLFYLFPSPFLYFTNTMDAKNPVKIVKATLTKSTRSFSKGQVVYIYDGFWGMAERIKVIGRYRRKHRFVIGVCPMDNVTNYKEVTIHDPRILALLKKNDITPKFKVPLWAKRKEKTDS